MIPSNIVNRVAASTANAATLAEIQSLWDKQERLRPCRMCYGYGFCEDDPEIPILFSERFDTPSVSCPECGSENYHFGDDDDDGEAEAEEIDKLSSKIYSPKSMSDILKNFRTELCVELLDIRESQKML